MTYEEFIEKLKQQAHEEYGYPLELMKFYPEGYESNDPHEITFIKDSNLRYCGEEGCLLLTDFLVFIMSKDNLPDKIHRVATKRMYEDYQKDGFDAAFKHIRDVMNNIKAAEIDENRVKQRLEGTYEQVRDRLIIRPLNYDLHIQDLKGCVYKKINDFCLVLYHLMGNANHILMTSKVHRIELKRWGVDEETALRDALENTARLYPPCVFDMRTQKEENVLEKEFTREDITMQLHSNMLMLSAMNTPNGAVALFYPGVIEKMMKIMGGPFTAVFMNINDVLIFDKDDRMAVEYAKTAKESGPMGEMLSGRLYLCNGKQVIPGIVVEIDNDGAMTVE